MIKAVIFAFDGVIVSTKRFHFMAWEKVAEIESIDFNENIYNTIKDMPRMEALDTLLLNAHKKYKEMDKIRLSNQKNAIYLEMVNGITSNDLLPGVFEIIRFFKENKVPMAIGSISRNCKAILTLLEMNSVFQAVVDGNDITRPKPDPEVFEKAARKLGVNPKDCLVIEDSIRGIEAAHSAEMQSFALGDARQSRLATYYGLDLSEIETIFTI